MLKKLDKLILQSFFGPFILTSVVVTFILLTQTLMRYFDDFVGKDLGFIVFSELISYFSISITPVAFPLAVLLSSLMTFGNLGEHFELTAIKSAGISLLRAMRPIFIFVFLLTAFVLYSNNYIVPKANLDSYSLLYDIRQKKPSLDIKEGAFYNGIPGYSIKANKKFADSESMKDIMVYNHSNGRGNVEVTIADSARMYTILDDQYLVMELFKGRTFSEGEDKNSNTGKPNPFVRSEFEKNKVIFSLASFDLQRTDKELFTSNKLMKNRDQLLHDRDSMRIDGNRARKNIHEYVSRFHTYHLADKDLVKPQRLIDFETVLARLEEERIQKQKQDSIKKVQDSVRRVERQAKLEAEDSSFNERKARREVKSKEDILASNNKDSAKEIKTANEEQKKIPEDKPKQEQSGREQITKNEELNSEKSAKEKVLIDGKLLNKDSVRSRSAAAKFTTDIYEIKKYNPELISRIDSASLGKYILKNEIDKARFAKNRIKGEVNRIVNREKEALVYDIYAKEKIAQAIACLVMFLIGAPLGAIIKKGGLGVPILISIVFFIFSYIMSQTGIKFGREGMIEPWLAVSISNMVLLPFGLLFLYQARNDSRLFDLDAYYIFVDRMKKRFSKKEKKAD